MARLDPRTIADLGRISAGLRAARQLRDGDPGDEPAQLRAEEMMTRAIESYRDILLCEMNRCKKILDLRLRRRNRRSAPRPQLAEARRWLAEMESFQAALRALMEQSDPSADPLDSDRHS